MNTFTETINKRWKKLLTVINRFTEKKYSFFIVYTIVFALVSFLVYGYFIYLKRTTVWDVDGLCQCYPALMYARRYVRTLIKCILFDHTVQIPMWSHSFGFGADIYTSMYYFMTDFMMWFSAILPESSLPGYYFFVHIIRLYIGGLCFSYFSLSHGNKKTATICGALVFVFAKVGMQQGLHYPPFSVPFVYFPLMLIGIDRISKRKSPVVFILSSAMFAIKNFYLFYMGGIFAAMYVLFSYFAKMTVYNTDKKFDMKDFLKYIGRYAVYAVNILLIASVILLPLIKILVSNSRLENHTKIPLLYSLKFYIEFLANFGTTKELAFGLDAAYPLAIIAVIIMFVMRKRFTGLKICFAVLIFCIGFPYAGHILNGFSYITNRWEWVFSFLLGMITAAVIPCIKELTAGQKKTVGLVLVIISIVTILTYYTRTYRAMSMLIITLSVVLIMGFVTTRTRQSTIAIFSLVFISAAIAQNAYYLYSDQDTEGGSIIETYVNKDTLFEKTSIGEVESILPAITDDDFFRINETGAVSTRGHAIATGLPLGSYYYSIIDSPVDAFLHEMKINIPRDYDYNGLDRRSILDALSCVRYYLVMEKKEDYLPGNYKDNKVNEKEIYVGKTELFEANTYLPVGYTYDSYVPRSEFEKMNVEDKQEVMLQGAVTEESILPVAVYEKENKSIYEDIIATDNVTIEGNRIRAGDNGSITVKIDPLEDSELYCIIDDISFEEMSPKELRNEEEWENYSEEKKNRIIRGEKNKEAVNSCEIAVEMGDVEKRAKYRRPEHQYYTGMDGFLINLGYQSDAEEEEMKVTFKEPGIYTFGRFDVVSQPLENLDSRLEKLKEDSLRDIHIGVNEITGTLELEKPKLLCMSVPYSTGWKAYVDGIETPVKNVNVMYMGIEVDKGHHDIRFVYRTPFWGVKEGLCILGLLMVLIQFIIYRRRKGSEVKG